MGTAAGIFVIASIQTLVAFLLLLTPDSASSAPPSRIEQENALPGTQRWWYSQPSAEPVLRGFSTRFSYLPGSTVSFKISSPPFITSYELQVFRLGYYGGAGGRSVANLTVTNTTVCVTQPRCFFEASSRLTDCSNWQTSIQWTIPSSSISGVYIALPVLSSHRLVPNATIPVPIGPHSAYPAASPPELLDWKSVDIYISSVRYGSYIPFVVKEGLSVADSPPQQQGSDILFKLSDLTWVAYNKFGSWNVYRGNGSFEFSSRAFKASYNRPFQNRLRPPEGQHQNFLFGSEYPLIYWLEKHGYDVTYASCADVEDIFGIRDSSSDSSRDSYPGQIEEPGPGPPNYKVLLSVGHDEYWTQGLRVAFENARELGVNIAFLSGNEMFWRVVWEERSSNSKADMVALAGKSVGSVGSVESVSRATGTTGSTWESSHVAQNASFLHSTTAGATIASSLTSGILYMPSSATASNNHVGVLQQRSVGDRRVILCRKETIENVPPLSYHDWSGENYLS